MTIYETIEQAHFASDAVEPAKDQPNLGCATTRELLQELWSRIEVDGKIDDRTIDS